MALQQRRDVRNGLLKYSINGSSNFDGSGTMPLNTPASKSSLLNSAFSPPSTADKFSASISVVGLTAYA